MKNIFDDYLDVNNRVQYDSIESEIQAHNSKRDIEYDHAMAELLINELKQVEEWNDCPGQYKVEIEWLKTILNS